MNEHTKIAEPAEIPVKDHPTIAKPRIGVLIVNLGTPSEATPAAVRRYLREFLSDIRVVDLPRPLWLPILYGVILPVRSGATARNYQKIWRTESNESPLRYYTRRKAEALSDALDGDITIDWAMRYGEPSIGERINALHKAGCTRILVVPLYPQYSATTTASVADGVFAALKKMRWQPTIRMAAPFYDDPTYIEALATSAQRHLSSLNHEPERIILSYHGLPQRYFDAGDPYHCHCAKTSRLLREAMNWSDEFAPMAFQSKFGREKWLEPATDAMIDDFAAKGVKRLAVMAPSFVADCIETLEELDIAAREAFLSGGGEHFSVVPCLNDAPEMISSLSALIRRETSGWTDVS